ncbi:MAG: phosphatidate cytidylyltransferase [Bacilli bacterium]|nr:phosphatidate cytidylyltransferase [Bacilli bacterium]
MNELSSSSKKSMLTRIITACCIVAVCLPAVLLGGWYYFAIFFFLAMVGVYEFVKAPNKERFNPIIYFICFVMVGSFILWQFLKKYMTGFQGDFLDMGTISISTMGILTYFLILFITCLISEKFTISDASYLFTMGIYISLSFSSILFLRFLPSLDSFYGDDLRGSLLIFYVLIGTFITDVGAYFVGVLFGKHKMAPRISPNKTWEGFFGGVVFSFVFSFLFAFTCDKLGAPLLKGVLDFNDLNFLWIILISAIMPLCANFGDLIFSAIKRNYSIKDFGRVFPGHGGVLDRFDSLTFTASVVALLVIMIEHGWDFLK